MIYKIVQVKVVLMETSLGWDGIICLHKNIVYFSLTPLYFFKLSLKLLKTICVRYYFCSDIWAMYIKFEIHIYHSNFLEIYRIASIMNELLDNYLTMYNVATLFYTGFVSVNFHIRPILTFLCKYFDII